MTTKHGSEQRSAPRIADDHVTLPPRASLMVTVYCQYAIPDADTFVESDQSFLLDIGVSVARGIVNLKERKSQVLFTNFTEEYQDLNKGASIAFLKEIQEASDVIAVADFEPESDDACKAAHFFDANPEQQEQQNDRNN